MSRFDITQTNIAVERLLETTEKLAVGDNMIVYSADSRERPGPAVSDDQQQQPIWRDWT